MKIYFDNSATSFLKPKFIYESLSNYLQNFQGSANRTTSSVSYRMLDIIFQTRENMKKLINAKRSKNIIITQNATESLNIAILGYFKENDHLLISNFEHNSVARPLNYLKEKRNITYNIIPSTNEGFVDYTKIEENIKKNTKAVIINHCSNVSGNIQDIEKIGEICKKRDLKFFVDAAQSAGAINIDVQKSNIDILAMTGHKSLLAIQGVGLLYISDRIDFDPLKFGGTGNNSKEKIFSNEKPEKFECGTYNMPAIYTLYQSSKYILDNFEMIYEKEKEFTKYFLEKFLNLEEYKLLGTLDVNLRKPIFSIYHEKFSSNEIAFILDEVYNIISRVGLHCSYLSHEFFKTIDIGTIRLSLNFLNKKEEIDILIDSLNKIVKK